MRVVLSADMEACAQITDVREVLACRAEYWRTGRPKLTKDVVAAAAGLIDGGATEVILLDNHGSGNPWNVVLDALPDRVRAESVDVFDLPGMEIDGMLQVGYHPRAGVRGFIPHSYIPGLRLRVDGEEIGESHGRVWAAHTVLLGIVGHAAHERTLGSLTGTPFLVVQEGVDSHRAVPVFDEAAESAEAIRAFACQAMQGLGSASRPEPPRRFVFEASVRGVGEKAAKAMEDAGWGRVAEEDFSVELSVWAQARGLLASAMIAALEPFLEELTALDLTSFEAFGVQDPARLERLSRKFQDWTARMALAAA